jgi:DNA-directed RNA polymerase subunit K/omega
LNKYERARVLGVRALQLAGGMAPRINLLVVRSGRYVRLTDSLEIAEEELNQGKIPLCIPRTMHAGSNTEIWHVNELALEPGQRPPVHASKP